MRNYFEEMNIDYDELKRYEDIETYYDEVQDYSKLIQELQCDRVEVLKQIVNKNKEIERLNNIITKAIEAINVYQNEKTLSVGYQDLKRIRGILRGNKFDLQMFEEYLKELGEKNENE